MPAVYSDANLGIYRDPNVADDFRALLLGFEHGSILYCFQRDEGRRYTYTEIVAGKMPIQAEITEFGVSYALAITYKPRKGHMNSKALSIVHHHRVEIRVTSERFGSKRLNVDETSVEDEGEAAKFPDGGVLITWRGIVRS